MKWTCKYLLLPTIQSKQGNIVALKIRNVNIVKTILLIGILIAVIQPSKSYPGSIGASEKLRLEIESMNNNIEQFHITKNVNSLAGLYAEEFTFSPEYKPAILKISSLKKFFTDWFNTTNIKSYKKKIYLVEVYSDYVLEMGTFQFDYSTIDKRQKEYEGHYMILWKRKGSGELKIVSEIFGANRYIESQDVPYASVKLEQSRFTPKHSVSNRIYAEVIAFDDIVLKAVAEGDGDARARGFTEDAILMSNFDSIRVGMEAIRPKMLKTYSRDVSFKVNHTYFRIYDLGEYVFVTSHYKGGWGDTNNGGRFEGNMSNLMKRNIDGKLLMHRQVGNRDSEVVTGKR